jgi:two-component system, LytTR family, sensor kinase
MNSLSKKQLYWILQVAGWFSIVVIETINYTFFIDKKFDPIYIISFSVLAVIGIIVSHFYKKLYIRPGTFEKSASQIGLEGFKATLLISLIISVLINIPVLVTNFQYFLTAEGVIYLLGQYMNFMRYVVVWVIIYFLYKTLTRNGEITEHKLRVETQAKTSELELLKTQLNPHFLFNALNSIKALVLIDHDKAREAIIKLSELLRFSLNYEKSPYITLAEEMQEVRKYLELEKIRFGERFQFLIQPDEETLSHRIPPAMVLTLVENAIKHGISRLPDGGEVRVFACIQDDELCIEVLNSGQLLPANGTGIGLKNIRIRLHSLFGDLASCQLIAPEPGWVLAALRYPLPVPVL